MAKILIASLQDLKKFRPIAETSQDRVDPYIWEAQMNDIKPVLGDAFYNDFVTNYKDTGYAKHDEYQALLNGDTYEWDGGEVQFEGLMTVLCYYAIARYVTNNPINYTAYGVVTKVNAQSQPIDTRTISLNASGLKDMAKSFENDMRQFLDVNAADYPLYRYGKSINSPGGFTFFKG